MTGIGLESKFVPDKKPLFKTDFAQEKIKIGVMKNDSDQ